MKALALPLLFLCLLTQPSRAQLPDSVKTYIDSALHIMQTKSLYGKGLAWGVICDSAYSKATGATTYARAFPAIAYAFRQLKDYHGMVANDDTFYRYPPPVNFDEVLSAGIKKEFLKGQRIVTAALSGSVAYLRIPGMNVTRQEDVDKQAARLRDSLCRLLAQQPKALVIDLRMNTGGNSAPMLSGISPLFTNSLLGYGVNRDGKFLDPVRLRDGVVLDEAGNKLVNLGQSCAADGRMPIALLIGPSTVSSGEILAVFLKQQPNVRVFGEPTPGFCNATEGFLWMNNKGYLLLAVNRIADARKRVYTEMMVRPDVVVKSADNYDNISVDPTVQAALDWLKNKVKQK